MNKSGLIIRLAVVVVFTAICAGVVITQLFNRITYLNELALSEQKIQQLHNTVSATASIATYLQDEELIQEVINGLNSNDIVQNAQIYTDWDTDHATTKPANSTVFALYSPFEVTRKVGALIITPNVEHIKERAEQIGRDNTIVLALQASIVSFITLIVAYFVITKPILRIGHGLHHIEPGNRDRVKLPEYHTESELGLLVSDINSLLDKAEQQIEQERALRSEVELLEKRFRMLFENSTAPIVLMEPKGNILLYNNAFLGLVNKLNIPFKKNFGSYLKHLFLDEKLLDNTVQAAFNNDETATGEFKLHSNNSDTTVWVQAVITSTVTNDYKEYYQVTLHDISKRKQQLEILDHKANYDQLTQLFNRHAAEIKIQGFIDKRQPFALLLLDLNDFKPINDIYGHDAGDEILIHVTGQLTASLRKQDILSRWGGDEFVILLPSVTPDIVDKIAKKLYEKASKSYFLKEHDKSVGVTLSIGVSFFPDDKETLHTLVKGADQAMYEIKRNKVTHPEIYIKHYANLSHKLI